MYKALIGITAALVLAGCKSTPDNQPVVPELIVVSKDNIEWKSDRSLAYNITRMGHRADYGYGISDTTNPASATVSGRENSGLLDFALGLAGGDINNAIGSAVIGESTEATRNWPPFIVEFINVNEINPDNGRESYAFVKQRLLQKFSDAIEAYGDSRVLGAFDSKVKSGVFNIVYEGKLCDELTEQSLALNIPAEEIISWKPNYEDKQGVLSREGLCRQAFIPYLTGKVEDFYAVVTPTVKSGIINVAALTAVSENLNSYVVFPDIVTVKFDRGTRSATFNNNVAFVTKKGDIYYFDATETSTFQPK